MISLLIHAFLGLVTIVLSVRYNKHLYGQGGAGAMNGMEIANYLLAVASVCCGWYFNIIYMNSYPPEVTGWVHFTRMLFTNPAASSGSQDLLFTNCLFFPLLTIVDGPRRGLKHAWIWFVMSLFTSFGFAFGLYIAALERQLRWNKAHNV